MNSKYHVPHSVFRKILGIAEELAPLKSKKDPMIAAMAGFATGGIGLGLYLQSWADFLIPGAILLFLVIVSLFTAGVPMLFIPVVWAIYGFKRVQASNRKLASCNDDFIEAEIISPPPLRAPRPISTASVESRLRQLDDLLRTGVLTQIEHTTKRQQILNEL